MFGIVAHQECDFSPQLSFRDTRVKTSWLPWTIRFEILKLLFWPLSLVSSFLFFGTRSSLVMPTRPLQSTLSILLFALGSHAGSLSTELSPWAFFTMRQLQRTEEGRRGRRRESESLGMWVQHCREVVAM